MNLGDEAARKFHHRRVSLLDFVRSYQHGGAGVARLGERVREVCYFVSGKLTAVRIRQMPVGDSDGDLAESGSDTHTPIRFTFFPDFNSRRVGLVGDDRAAGKPNKASDKSIDAAGG